MKLRSRALSLPNTKSFAKTVGLALVTLLFFINFTGRDFLLLPFLVFPVALYTTGESGYGPDCCLTNHLLRTLGRIEKGCSLARRGDFVLLPPDLEIGGAFRTDLSVFTDEAIEELGRLARVSGWMDGGARWTSAAASRTQHEIFNTNPLPNLLSRKENLNCNLVPSSSVPRSVARVSYKHRKRFSAHPILRAWLASALSLPSSLEKAVQECGGGNLSSTATVHMRIESDWYNTVYSKTRNVPYCVMKQAQEGRWFCYSPADILRIIKNSRDEFADDVEILTLLYSQPAEKFAEGTGEGAIEVAER